MRTRRTMAMIAAVIMALSTFSAGSALAAPKPPKAWNLYQGKLGVYNCSTGTPKGQTLIAGPFTSQADCTVALSTPPVISYVLDPAAPDGQPDWYVSDVSLTWTVTDPDTPNTLVKTGCVDQVMTADQAATTYECSATSVGGSAGPVRVSVQRDATAPIITWDGLIADGDKFFVGQVPAEPTVSATDATSGVDSVTMTGYGTEVGTHTLTATAIDVAGNQTVERRGYTVTLKPAEVVAPTKTDQSCAGPGQVVHGGITIPTVEGVDYYINDGSGPRLAQGGYGEHGYGAYTVTAVAQDGYQLVGYDGPWQLTIAANDCIVHVGPVEGPTVVNETCALNDSGVIIPTVPANVTYYAFGMLDGAGWFGKVDEGFHRFDPVTAEHPMRVWAVADPGYAIDGEWEWYLSIDAATGCAIEVTPTPSRIGHAEETRRAVHRAELVRQRRHTVD